jgi:adenylate cyclase
MIKPRTFFQELKRRNVIRVGAAYAVVAWLLIEVSDTIFPRLGIPEWTVTFVIVLLLLGLPLALFLAWAYELTPDGLRRETEVATQEAGSTGSRRRMDRFIVAGLVVVIAIMGAERIWFAGGEAPSLSDSTGEISIGVLAFANMSEDPENEHFADGISEEILNILAGIEGLRVASRTSAFSFKGQGAGIPEIARALNVSHVLEGSVRRQAGRVRITAQLIRADTDGHLWSQTYDRDLSDIFQVQEEIAAAITEALEAVLGTRRVVVEASTDDLEVYERFLRGRALLHRRVEIDRAIEDLRWAVERDPAFGEAWAYLAVAYGVAPGYRTEISNQSARDGAADALGHASRLAPNDPLVLAFQGTDRSRRGDFVGGVELLRRAASMRTPDSNPVLWYGQHLLMAGYPGDALEVLDRAADMDPMSGLVHGWLAHAYLALGRMEEAETHTARAVDRGWSVAARFFAVELFRRGDLERASYWWEQFGDGTSRPDFAVFTEPERRGELLEALDAILGPVPHDELALWGREEEFLDRAFAASEAGYLDVWNLRAPWQGSDLRLREHPRFFELARQIGLMDLWEIRGYPPGCTRIASAEGDRLDCSGMRRAAS